MKKGVRILLIVLMLLISGAAYLYFRIRAGVDSAVNVQKLEDGFYYMEYRDDYGFDRFLEQGGAASDLDVAKFVGKALFKGFLYPRFLGGSFGCSTLSARNPKGGVADLNKRLADRELTIELTMGAKEFVTDKGYDPAYGARPLKRYLQKNVETLAARIILGDGVREGSTIVIDVDEDKTRLIAYVE